MHSWRLLQRYGVPCDVLCVVHDRNVGHPIEVYEYLREIGADYMQFLPLVERDGAEGKASRESVQPEAYGTFLTTIFHRWFTRDVRQIGVQIFEEAARPLLGMDHAMCHYRPVCGDAPVVEHNGDLYACDHYVDREHHIGNLCDMSLAEMLTCAPQREFGRAKWETLPRMCLACDVLDMCNGGCPKDRFLRTPEGEEGLNYLCVGLQHFFRDCRPILERLASHRQPGRPVTRLMDLLPSVDGHGSAAPGRNDPCPCGSGKKYKRCCLGRHTGR
jgi:uncharacterized protein